METSGAAIRLNENVVRSNRSRPIRNKRYTRRAYGEDKRPPKRLFTPEIKRFLKDWLVRRRDNPYPNRDEKKTLAVQTGLTYIQVCNWFANWRRKLKNAGKEPQRKTWGDLIKTYNSQVQGNVEHFSICSDDSIWEEPESGTSSSYDEKLDHSYTFIEANNNNNGADHQNQCYFISSTTVENENESTQTTNPFIQSAKYKNHIMEKYLRDCQQPKKNGKADDDDEEDDLDEELSKPSMISKWLESAVNFRPSENNYLWTFNKNAKKKKKAVLAPTTSPSANNSYHSPLIHGREELDAAEALTRLANANRNI